MICSMDYLDVKWICACAEEPIIHVINPDGSWASVALLCRIVAPNHTHLLLYIRLPNRLSNMNKILLVCHWYYEDLQQQVCVLKTPVISPFFFISIFVGFSLCQNVIVRRYDKLFPPYSQRTQKIDQGTSGFIYFVLTPTSCSISLLCMHGLTESYN